MINTMFLSGKVTNFALNLFLKMYVHILFQECNLNQKTEDIQFDVTKSLGGEELKVSGHEEESKLAGQLSTRKAFFWRSSGLSWRRSAS